MTTVRDSVVSVEGRRGVDGTADTDARRELSLDARREPTPDARREPTLTALAHDLDRAHLSGVVAAVAGLQDPALGAGRLTGSGVVTLAEAAISSATPFLRAPLLGRLSRVQQLHPTAGVDDGQCPACGVPAPCDTALELRW